jgi:chromosome segregation ATPase
MMQGETDDLSTLKPEQLTEYLERVSGSISLREEYGALRSELESVKAEIQKNTTKLN